MVVLNTAHLNLGSIHSFILEISARILYLDLDSFYDLRASLNKVPRMWYGR